VTTIRRLYFEPSDILAIQLECKNKNCGARISCPLKDWKPTPPIKCPKCSVPLLPNPNPNAKDFIALQELANGLNTLLTVGDTFEFRVRFEFDDKSDGTL
jgi:hypothetical protein